MNINTWYSHINSVLQHMDTEKHLKLMYDIQNSPDQVAFDLPQELLQKASEYGHSDLLIQIFTTFPSLHNTMVVNFALKDAARHGHVACLEVLLPHRQMEHLCTMALEEAALRGHAACVERLIPLSNCLDMDSSPLRCAAKGNHLDCLNLLIPHSNAHARRCEALQNAAGHKNKAMVDALYPLCSEEQIKEALGLMEDSIGHEYSYDDFEFLQQRYTASLLTQIVAPAVEIKTSSRGRKKL